jgi:flagellar protein FlaG
METKVAAVAAAPDPGTAQVPASPAAKAGGATPGAGAPDQVDMRLVIELDKASGSYVYKTINRVTGEVVSQLPRDEVLRLKEEGAYAAGAVIRTEA